MLDAIITAIREIIDFRRKGREDKKIGLEIQQLEQQQQEKQRLIQPASFEDVKTFDSRYAAIGRRVAEIPCPTKASEWAGPPRFRRLGWLVFLIALLLVLLALLIWHFSH